MKVLLDTSVLVAAFIEGHPRHTQALSWLQRVKSREIEGFVSAHTLAELYAVLTALPVRPRISPKVAWRLVQDNVLGDFKAITLSKADYQTVLKTLVAGQASGGATYDALIARTAEKAGVERLVTLNPEDFRRVWPRLASRVTSP